MEHMDVAEFLSQTLTQAVGGVGVQKTGIGDEADHAAVADTIAGPADCADVTVIERVL